MPTLHALHEQLTALGITGADTLEPFQPRVRDRDDIAVYRCTRSGVILLDRIDHVGQDYYVRKEHPEIQLLGARDKVAERHREDTERRAQSFGDAISGRDWVDVGTGSGAILDRLAPSASSARAVEPQSDFFQMLNDNGYDVVRDVAELATDSADVVTEFHVLEHVPDPVGHLGTLRRVLRSDGTLIVEVPHANDFLLGFLDVEEFRAFTAWSEHLVLHTRESLSRVLSEAGFGDAVITGVQRYPLANHLHWLARGRPGGHEQWWFLRDAELDRRYADLLARLDATDTLVAVARP